MQSPCKDCKFKSQNKIKFHRCVGCEKVAIFVQLMELNNPFPVLGDNTPRVNTGDIPHQGEPWD
jgi:hypothetical protein